MSKELALIVVVTLFLGCKSAEKSTPLVSQTPLDPQTLAQPSAATPPAKGFSWRNVMEMASFIMPASSDDGLVPPQILHLTATANTIVTQASELSTSDPPQVTIQKAQAILESLRPWDNLMATAKTMGLVDEQTAAPLQAIVDQLRIQTNALIQIGAQPETITAIQQLAGQLKVAGGSIVSMFAPSRENS